MRKLHFVSNLTGSIGQISTKLAVDLKKHFDLTKEWEGQEPEEKDILLCHFIKPDIVNHIEFNNFKKKILIQPIDGTDILPDFVNLFNKFDLIICPAKASKIILKRNDVTVPIEVIPNYYEDDIFEKPITSKIEKYLPQDKIIIYHESTFHPRKGIELLYEGYVRAFSDTEYVDNVLLVLKDSYYNKMTFLEIENLKRLTMKLQKQFKKPAKIIKFSSLLSVDDLKILWNRCNIYASFSKIEGFGIPMLTHYLLGKSVLCLDNPYSGYNDYLAASTAYFVPSKQTKAKNEFMELYSKKTEWAVPNIADVINCLKTAYKDCINGTNLTINSVSENLKPMLLQNHSYKKIVDMYVETIKKV